MPKNSSPLNLIIPMAGRGKRFQKALYTTFKPFIPIQGKPMVQYVTEAFPGDVRKWVITPKAYLTEEQENFLKKKLGCELIDVEPHEEGPAFSIFQARHRLPLDESFFISYCDIFWKWDFSEIRKKLDVDGVIYTHQGFHPHLIDNHYSAFCLPRADDNNFLKEIREKSPFTLDWMNEPLSIGVFFVKSGLRMMPAIEGLIQKNIRVANEFFPSLLFNALVQNQRRVLLKALPFYVHWGVPEQLKDFERWSAVFEQEKNFRPQGGRDLPEQVVMMAGLGNRMKQVSPHPKALIPIHGEPMFEFVRRRFPHRRSTLITTPDIVRILDRQKTAAHFFALEGQTASQFDTLKESVGLLKEKRDFFLISCDAYGLFDFEKFRIFTKERRPDAVIFTFHPSLTQNKMAKHHTHVSAAGEKVTAVHIKAKPQSDCPGFAGFFWVGNGEIFEKILKIPAQTPNEMSVDHCFKYFVECGMDIVRCDLDHYVHLGTPEELLEYDYWFAKAFDRPALL